MLWLADPAQFCSVILLGLLTLFAVQALLDVAEDWLPGCTAGSVLADLSTRPYDHLQTLPLAFSPKRPHTHALAVLTNIVGHLAAHIRGTLLSIVPLTLTSVGAVLLTLRVDTRLTLLVMMLVIPLHIRAGETIVLTGSNGVGKSTLADLLVNIMDPFAGRILKDGIIVARITLSSLRRQIHVTLQNGIPVNSAPYENIISSMPDLAFEVVVATVSRALEDAVNLDVCLNLAGLLKPNNELDAE